MTAKNMNEKHAAQERLSTIIKTSIDKAIENAHNVSGILSDSNKDEINIAAARILLAKAEELMANLPQDFKQTCEILLNGFRYRTTPKEIVNEESEPEPGA